jgi:hypothetical protein
MGHFEMVSTKTVAGQPEACVEQLLFHQTDAWNDIKGVGWYEHH